MRLPCNFSAIDFNVFLKRLRAVDHLCECKKSKLKNNLFRLSLVCKRPIVFKGIIFEDHLQKNMSSLRLTIVIVCLGPNRCIDLKVVCNHIFQLR